MQTVDAEHAPPRARQGETSAAFFRVEADAAVERCAAEGGGVVGLEGEPEGGVQVGRGWCWDSRLRD